MFEYPGNIHGWIQSNRVQRRVEDNGEQYLASILVGASAAAISDFFLKFSSKMTLLAIGWAAAAAFFPYAHSIIMQERDKVRALRDEEYVRCLTVELPERRRMEQENLERMQAQTDTFVNQLITDGAGEAIVRLVLRKMPTALPRNLNTGNKPREA